jgi:hypothetical protein
VQDSAKGAKTYNELLEMVYEPFGYEYDEVKGKNCTPNSILFPLKYKSFECSAVFLDWLEVQIKSNITVDTKDPPPKEIPENLKDKYLLNGFSQLRPYYINEIPANLPKTILEPWTDAVINKYISWYNNSNWGALPYGGECGLIVLLCFNFKQFQQNRRIVETG